MARRPVPSLRLDLPDELLDELVGRVADELERRGVSARASRWLTLDEAAAYIGARPQRIYDLRSSGRLRRTGDGGRVLVDRRELDALIERGLA